MLAACAGAGVAVATYGGVTSEPVLEFVEGALALLRAEGCDGVIAIGGGSVIDTAKATAALATNGGRLPEYEGVDRFRAPPLPLIAVPTTAGTGSEATRAAVITDRQRNVKMLLMADALLPRAAVDDPLLTLTVPPGPTAAAGLDALTHAVEAYLSRRAQPLTDTLALAAMRTIPEALPRAWRDGSDLQAREAMMTAQLQAGLAFSNSSVALVHGMARPLGAHFGVPHGLANAMLLPEVLRFTLPGAPERFARIAEAMGGAGRRAAGRWSWWRPWPGSCGCRRCGSSGCRRRPSARRCARWRRAPWPAGARPTTPAWRPSRRSAPSTGAVYDSA